MDGHPAKFSFQMLFTLKEYVGYVMLISVLGIIMSQADKMLLSKMSPLEDYGFYMLAWAVASGLSRVSTPLIQAFSPQFTELLAKGDEEGVATKIRLASQLMSVLIVPPAALMVVIPKPILVVWLGSEITAEGTAPILAVMVVGTMFASCSSPSVSILYSRKKLMPVLAVNLICLMGLVPLLIFAIVHFSIMGAAYVWGLYGLILYVAYQVIGLRGLPGTAIFSSIMKNFVAPCLASFAVAGVAGYWLTEVRESITFVLLFIVALLLGWIAALFSCEDLRKIAMKKWIW